MCGLGTGFGDDTRLAVHREHHHDGETMMTCEYPQLHAQLRVQLLAGDVLIAEIEDPCVWQRVLADTFGRATRPETASTVAEVPAGVAEPPPDVAELPPASSESSSEAEASINTNTAAGRRAYDAEVLAVLREIKGTTGAWVKSEQLRPLVGGTPSQLGASLRRLCAGGELHWTGVARGTKYIVAEPAAGAE